MLLSLQVFWTAALLLVPSVVANVSLSLGARDLNPVDFSDCYVRFQQIKGNQSPQDARVTQAVWATTEQDFTNTIINFGNAGGGNTQLWLQDNAALLYAGFYTCQSRPFNPQYGLSQPNVVGSLILPSGVAKLNRVGPVAGSLSAADARSASVIFGLANKTPDVPLTGDDYAYFQNQALIDAITTWYNEYNAARFNPRPSEAYFSAITGNGASVQVTIKGLFLD